MNKIRIAAIAVSAGLVISSFVWLAPSATAETIFTVTTTADDGAGSLRQAIVDANSNSGSDRIEFSISGAAPAIIAPLTPLPAITESVVVDATAGGCSGAAPIVVLDGAQAANTTGYDQFPGLVVAGGASVIRGLSIRSFNGPGVRLTSSDNTVECSWVGVDDTGVTAAGNHNGIEVRQGSNNVIGGMGSINGNVISGNANGVDIALASTGNVVQHNLIGTDVSGIAAIGNGNVGVSLASAGNTLLNNIMSGNYYGAEIANAPNTIMRGNRIGTNAAGTAALGNQVIGVEINQSSNTVVGGSQPGEGNLISGNGSAYPGEGLRVFWSPGTVVKGNLIGTDVTGTQRMGNTSYGVFLLDTTTTTVGGSLPGEGNVIGASGYDGIDVLGCVAGPNCSSPADTNQILGNHIGVGLNGEDLGNAWSGIELYQASNTTIGGAGDAQNYIGFNREGIKITGTAPGNDIGANSIDNNLNLGIDLSGDGVTANDADDSDIGPNNLQNFPELSSAFTDGSTTTTVTGSLHSAANSSYTVRLFDSPSCDPSGFGEGRVDLGTTSVATNGAGSGSFSVDLNYAAQLGSAISATATDAAGNTSEFSACQTVTTSGPMLSSLSPNSVQACTSCADVPFDLHGQRFDTASVVEWDGNALATTVRDSTLLSAVIPAAYLASPGTHQVDVSGPSGSTDPLPFFVTATSATVESSDTATGTDPVVSSGAVSAAASGSGTISVAEYTADPLNGPPPAGASNYIDVNVAPDSSFTSLTVVDCALDPTNTSHVIYWWDGSAWLPVSDQTYDSTTGCVTMTFSAVTSPSVTQLIGTVFADIPASSRTVNLAANTEGLLRVLAGDRLAAGYELKLAMKAKKSITVSLSNVSVVLPISCGNGAQGKQLIVPLAPATYTLPAGSTAWLPTNDNNAPSGFQGSLQVTDVCGGSGMKTTNVGARLMATLSTSPGTVLTAIALHYRDPRAKGMANINCADPVANPAPGVKACTASWSSSSTF